MKSVIFASLFAFAFSADSELSSKTVVPLTTFGPYLQRDHTHVSILDPDGVFTVLWTPDLKMQEVVFEVHARTLGWAGFGFSPNGGMRGADIVTMWIKEGSLYLQDRHAFEEALPPLDDQGNYRPLYAAENETHTTVVFSRKINTCDPQDFILTNETVYLIYAWSEEDPTDENGLEYHGMRRGSRQALILLPFHRETLTSDIQTWTIRQSMKVPHTQHTFYWCHIEKIPKWEKKHHYVGFDMIYGKNSRKHLHHAVAFECHAVAGEPTDQIFEQYLSDGGHECYTPNMPVDFYLCEHFLINWAIGSEGEMLPETVGYPLGDLHGGSTYVLFQVHYDNPQLSREIEVEWGMNIYYTEKLRTNDASNIALGHSILFSLTVPPQQRYWKVTGHCSSACTDAELPENGINVFTVFLHGHYLVEGLRLRHFRNGVELPTILEDTNYSADFQQSRRLPKEVKILPGDHLTVECDYNSMERNTATFSGWRSRDEMCQAFINYYPKVKMALCRSSPSVESVGKAFRTTKIPRDLNLYEYVLNPRLTSGEFYQDYINRLDWNDFDIAKTNKQLYDGEHAIKCQYNYNDKVQISTNVTRYPEFIPYIPPRDLTCEGDQHQGESHQITQGSPASSALQHGVSSLLVTLALLVPSKY